MSCDYADAIADAQVYSEYTVPNSYQKCIESVQPTKYLQLLITQN